MGPLKRSLERMFWKRLCRFFKPLIDRIKNGLNLSTLGNEERRLIQSSKSDEELTRILLNTAEEIRKDSARGWREAASKAGSTLGYKAVKNELQGPVGARIAQIVADNAAYIKTLPQQWAQFVTKYAYEEGLKGKRPKQIEEELRQMMPGHITRNLKTIARTECAKANAAIVQARAESVGIRAYIWRSVKDERSRDAHKAMDGILVFFSDPPNPEALFGGKPYGNYHAGNTFNCRCYMEPVVTTALLPDTIRVHDHGSIRSMAKAQIEKQFGKIC